MHQTHPKISFAVLLSAFLWGPLSESGFAQETAGKKVELSQEDREDLKAIENYRKAQTPGTILNNTDKRHQSTRLLIIQSHCKLILRQIDFKPFLKRKQTPAPQTNQPQTK